MDSHFEVDDGGGDLWYNSFRRSECDGHLSAPHCKRFPSVGSASYAVRSIEEHQQSPDLVLQHFVDKDESMDQGSVEYTNEDELRIDRDLSDQVSPKKNDLSHEADYKLSKFEQEPSFLNQSKMLTRRKRSLAKTLNAKQSQGRPIAILSNSETVDRNLASKRNVKKQTSDELYDEEIAFPEPMLAEEVLTNLGIKTIVKNVETTVDGGSQTEVLDDEDLLRMLSTTEETTNGKPKNEHKKNHIGITLELKVNNVTRQKIEAVTQLRRRKKSPAAENEMAGSPKDQM